MIIDDINVFLQLECRRTQKKVICLFNLYSSNFTSLSTHIQIPTNLVSDNNYRDKGTVVQVFVVFNEYYVLTIYNFSNYLINIMCVVIVSFVIDIYNLNEL